MKLNSLHRFMLLAAGATIFAVIASGFALSAILSAMLKTRESQSAAELVRTVRTNDLTVNVFTAAVTEGNPAPFVRVWRHLQQDPDFFRLKIYDTHKQVIWSDEPRLIGQVFPDNAALATALSGSVVVELGVSKPSHQYEKAVVPESEILETYVPLVSRRTSAVYGVVALYEHPAASLASIRLCVTAVRLATFSVGAVISFALFGLLRHAGRQQQRLRTEEQRAILADREMTWALQVQQCLLPEKLPNVPGFSLAALYRPAQTIGGDYYDVFRARDGSIALVIADNEGKGVGGAIRMAQTQSMLRVHVETFSGAMEVVRGINETLTVRAPVPGLLTLFLARLDPFSKRMTFCNAGHPAPLLLHKRTFRPLEAGGLPLGIEADADYKEGEVQLEIGDAVLFYTDGLTEACNANGEQFGVERLKRALASLPEGAGPDAIIQRVMQAEKGFRGCRDWEDDVTLICLAACATPCTFPIQQDDSKRTIPEILSSFQCPEGFKCVKHNFKEMCRAEDVGLSNFLVCLEERSSKCQFAVPFERKIYCHCPMRVHLAKTRTPSAQT